MEHRDVAKRVITAVGGEDNIVGAAHCATRLRMVLKDSGIVDTAALDNDPDLKGTFETGGMYQIIVGPGDVDLVFDEMDKMTAKNIAVSTEELKGVAANQGNWFTRAIKVLADIFVPLIPILVGGGLLMALNNVLTAEGLFGENSLVQMFPQIQGLSEIINVLASAPFAFLPVLVGYSATKRFGGNEYLGAGIGMAMVHPALVNGYDVGVAAANGELPYWDLFGLPVAQAGYQGAVLPVLAVAWILATIEKWFHRRLKGTVDFLVTPLATLLITGFITFIAVGPAMRWLSDLLITGLSTLYETGGPIGGFIFGLVYSPIVITGLHQSFPPIELELFNQGGSFIFATASMANIAQGAVALAVAALTKNEKLKGLATSAGTPALFGITEPAIFGVNLRLRWPFFIGMGAAGIGGMLIALFDVKAVALGAAGFIGAVSIRSTDVPTFLVLCVVTFVVAFAAAYAYGRYLIARQGTIDPDSPDDVRADEAAAATLHEASENALRVASPLTGRAMPLSDVSDPMFAQSKLGEGVAIHPSIGELRSPIDGKVAVTFPSGHAYAIRGKGSDGKNVDVLMHIGFDTVNLKGEHFTAHVSKGDEVEAGTLLATFDIGAIEAAGYEVTTPVVVSNTKKVGQIAPLLLLPAEITTGEELFSVEPKTEEPVATGEPAAGSTGVEP
ncbi:PTS system beta-glucoside-specific EIIBCA component [Corynebacterium glaucum]|uniref:protein-N(pi)-phosphohistidine--sucrose phosphotransferase n=1 Tax=Corynebacterium glaucum TaxID=187491 RepID=A0A1Q2HUA2_9CORY|nr:sucrose-specific PTS transporter subunit IIBC [Corynebacterium glaucum]AQQ14380.1 PTS system beta-glucoside-specific EIIBCA component [Corynebacterium glaucum]